MSPEEAVNTYFAKKQSGEYNKSEIKADLKDIHHFSDETIKSILIGISNCELETITQEKKPLLAFFEHIYFSYFFVVFGIVAIVVSLFLMLQEAKTDLSKYLPWAIIVGAVFLIYKHASRILIKDKS